MTDGRTHEQWKVVQYSVGAESAIILIIIIVTLIIIIIIIITIIVPQVCADDQKTCCTTPPLKKTFSDDWSANDLEQWGPDYFGKNEE